MDINRETINDIKEFVMEGFDHAWCYVYDGYLIINRIRKTLGLPELSDSEISLGKEYWEYLE